MELSCNCGPTLLASLISDNIRYTLVIEVYWVLYKFLKNSFSNTVDIFIFGLTLGLLFKILCVSGIFIVNYDILYIKIYRFLISINYALN